MGFVGNILLFVAGSNEFDGGKGRKKMLILILSHDINIQEVHCESKKGCLPNHGYNFVNSGWISKILSLLQRAVYFQQNPY